MKPLGSCPHTVAETQIPILKHKGTMVEQAEAHYKGVDMSDYFMFCCLSEDTDDGLMHLCGTFAQMCRMTQDDEY